MKNYYLWPDGNWCTENIAVDMLNIGYDVVFAKLVTKNELVTALRNIRKFKKSRKKYKKHRKHLRKIGATVL